MPRVLNKHRDGFTPGSEYIGRPSKWGNPFVIGYGCTREQAIQRYRELLDNLPQLRQAVRDELRGRDLVCYCAPAPCHGDVLLELANAP